MIVLSLLGIDRMASAFEHEDLAKAKGGGSSSP
jgi:hypothetical protein